MKATLEAPVEVWDIAVFSELGVWEQRPDLQLLCAAAERAGRLESNAIDALLPGLSERGRTNLVRYLEYIQLLDRSGTLTPLGRRCAQSGEAPSWEQGVYHLLAATHPLFTVQILEFKRAQSDGFDRDFHRIESLPSWLKPDHARVFTSVFDRSRRFSIASFPAARGQDPVCRSWQLDPGKLSWEIDLSTYANRWLITGQLDGKEQPRTFTSASESVDPTELAGIYAVWERRWDARQGRVLMPFDGRLGPGGRESFVRSWRYKTVTVGRVGSFEDVVVKDVPVGPANDDEARAWATAMVIGRVEHADNWVTPKGWASEWEDVVAAPPLASRAGDAPNAIKLTEVAGKALGRRTRWLLAAPTDLSLES